MLWAVLSNKQLRTTSPLEWEYALERVVDVKAWLRWLAANKVAGNWDSYGSTTGNLLIYFPPCGEPGTVTLSPSFWFFSDLSVHLGPVPPAPPPPPPPPALPMYI